MLDNIFDICGVIAIFGLCIAMFGLCIVVISDI